MHSHPVVIKRPHPANYPLGEGGGESQVVAVNLIKKTPA